MEDHPSVYSANSLQNLCLYRIICSLEHFSPQLLNCIPPSLRYQLFLRCPIVDICSFENSIAIDGIDCEALWGELYESHWKQWNQWKTEELITSRNMQFLPAGISNREKYFALITTMIFCLERPSGYIENLNIGHGYHYESIPQQTIEQYPTDIVNYLVAYDKKLDQNFKKIDEFGDHTADIYPVTQREVDNTVNDDNLHHNLYGLLAANNQFVPKRYLFLMKAVPRLSDSDAISLMMDKCNYIPKWIALSYTQNIDRWGLRDKELLSKFFGRVNEVHVNVFTECYMESHDEWCGDIVLTACFASPGVSSLSLHLFCETINHLCFSSEIYSLSLSRFQFSSNSDFTDTLVKELAEILEYHHNLCELKIGDTDGCDFPYKSSELLSAISAIICNPRFCKFSFEGCEISSSDVAQLLFFFFSTNSSHPQELSFKTNTISTADYIKIQSPMSLVGCDSALLNKVLKFDYCSAKLCSSLLSLKPLSLHEIYLSFPCSSAQEVHDVIESVADNDKLQVNNLVLINAGSYHNLQFEVSLPEAALTSILKRPNLESLRLDFKWKANDLNSLTNALCAQTALGSLKKLDITFDQLKTPKNFCDLELLIDSVFNLPQIATFCFDFDIHLPDFSIVEVVHKYWQTKRPKEFNLGHFVKMEVSEHNQSLIDEMQLVVKEYDASVHPCCKHANCLRLCISNNF